MGLGGAANHSRKSLPACLRLGGLQIQVMPAVDVAADRLQHYRLRGGVSGLGGGAQRISTNRIPSSETQAISQNASI